MDTTIPPTHEIPPPTFFAPIPYGSEDTNPVNIAKARTVARSRLKQKNRRANEFVITLPLNLTFETATNYSLQGFKRFGNFAPDGVWIVTDIEHRMTGKSGSTTKVTLRRSLNNY